MSTLAKTRGSRSRSHVTFFVNCSTPLGAAELEKMRWKIEKMKKSHPNRDWLIRHLNSAWSKVEDLLGFTLIFEEGCDFNYETRKTGLFFQGYQLIFYFGPSRAASFFFGSCCKVKISRHALSAYRIIDQIRWKFRTIVLVLLSAWIVDEQKRHILLLFHPSCQIGCRA